MSPDEKLSKLRLRSFFAFFYWRQALIPLSTVVYHYGGFRYTDVFVFGLRICRFHTT